MYKGSFCHSLKTQENFLQFDFRDYIYRAGAETSDTTITINNKEIHCIELSWHFFIFNPLQKTIGPFISWAYNILNLIVMAAPVYRIRIEIGIYKPTNTTAEKHEEKTTRIRVFFETKNYTHIALCHLLFL